MLFGVALFVSIIAIIRIPVNALTIPMCLAIYVIVTLAVFNELEQKTQTKVEKAKK